MIKPAIGYAFIIENTRELKKGTLSQEGFILSEKGLMGTSGVIYSINGDTCCSKCKKSIPQFKEGDNVIFSKFVAEQIDIDLPDVPRGRLRAVPVEMILGKICE